MKDPVYPENRTKADIRPLEYGRPAFSECGWQELVEESVAEACRAMRKFPQPNYVITKFAEESGEVVKAAVHVAEGRETATHMRDEMRQAIAMLYRLWVEGDQVHGLSPVWAAVIEEQRVNA